MSDPSLTRRDVILAMASAAALPLVAGCSPAKPASSSSSSAPGSPAGTPGGDAAALALLDDVAENFLKLFPDSASSLGLDVGANASLRSQLVDRSASGQKRIADQVRADLNRVNALNTDALSHAVKTSVEVVRSAYATSLEGFALPY